MHELFELIFEGLVHLAFSTKTGFVLLLLVVLAALVITALAGGVTF